MVKEDQEKSAFSECSSYLNIFYYIVVAVVTMLFMHPNILVLTFISLLILNVIMEGWSFLVRFTKTLFPLFVFIVILNPLISHAGSTALFFINDMPVTREGIIYGIAFAAMIVNMIILFHSFHNVMTSDKLMYLLKGKMPKLSLMLTMILRLVPRYKKEFEKINNAQKGLGEGTTDGSFVDRIRHVVEIVLGVITFALEDGIDTADAMVMRGYDLKDKTRYRREKISSFDKIILVFMGILFLGIVVFSFMGAFKIIYYPEIVIGKGQLINILGAVCYGIFATMPIIIEVKEMLLWNSLKQKI